MDFPINEIYATIQSEGRWAGTPAIFIRTQGCPVGCGWCDTKHTWEEDPLHLVDFIRDASIQEEKWTRADLQEILLQVEKEAGSGIRHVVITGGEPGLVENLETLIYRLKQKRMFVQIETSGCFAEICEARQAGAWITVSPKINMPGGYDLQDEAIASADEIKFPIGKQKDVGILLDFLEEYGLSQFRNVWVQPLSQSKKATAICVAACLTYGWNLSIQTHKYIEIP